MIDAAALLKDLQAELGRLVADLNARVAEDGEVRAGLEGEWRKAFDAQRTGRTFEDWLDDRLTQVAVAWLLACVFVRFGEDNGLIDEARIAGPGVRGAEARDAQQRFFVEHPHSNDREYLQDAFRSAALLRGLDGVVGEGESPLWLVDPPADAATRLVALFRTADEAGDLAHDFTDPDMDTRFLGDLYQDLSEHAKSAYALLQTPEFVEEFILDRTLTPAIETFGLAKTTIIDPTCGSGHFLLGGFQRLFDAWRAAEPGESVRVHADRAMSAVTGVDLNPFAAAIARFRLLVAALEACGERRLADAPDFHIDVAVGDSLLWAAGHAQIPQLVSDAAHVDRQFLYKTEHAEALRTVFAKQFTVVVGNPPYIIARDKALNAQYRERYPLACSGKYSLVAPFMQCFFDLATSTDGYGRPAGYVGMIAANSFMKREFGKPLIERLIPGWDLTHIIDTSGAYIPGHGTPTVILFGRHQLPVSPMVHTVMGLRGEPTIPADPKNGLVWSAILEQLAGGSNASDFAELNEVERARLSRHPWSIGGGGSSELRDRLERTAVQRLDDRIDLVGFGAIVGSDEAFVADSARQIERYGVEAGSHVRYVMGDSVRNWGLTLSPEALFPYTPDGSDLVELPTGANRRLWPVRASLAESLYFGKTNEERGLPWWNYAIFFPARYASPLSISFPFVSTHNHFMVDRGAKVFNKTAPIIKLPMGSTLDDHLELVGCLNSATAAFWLHQVMQPKDRSPEPWLTRYEHDGTKMRKLPLPLRSISTDLARRLDALASSVAASEPAAIVGAGSISGEVFDLARAESDGAIARMISLQEELDWEFLHLYGITEDRLVVPEGSEAPSLQLGERAFELVLAGRVASGDVETSWFERHGSMPVTELPAHWPEWYRDLVDRRIALIESDRDVALIERPEHKRRWAREPWERQTERALREWLQDRLEARELWFEGSGEAERAVCRSVAQLADRVVATDPEFLDVARLWKGVVEVDPVRVVRELVADEHVPAQSGSRYKAKGFDKRRLWERTWELQRLEDEGQPLPDGLDRIPVPPKYGSGDFAKASFWKHRGKLDVPKERFTSIACAERDADSTLVLAWAGFDHAQLAQAVGTLIEDRKQSDGWDAERSWPLVVAMAEQLFWLDLWHNEVDPRWGASPAGLYRGIVEQHALAANKTLADVADWRAPAATRGRKKKDGA